MLKGKIASIFPVLLGQNKNDYYLALTYFDRHFKSISDYWIQILEILCRNLFIFQHRIKHWYDRILSNWIL